MDESDPVGAPVAPAEPAEVVAVEPPPMQPVQLGERVEIIDVLRGFALFGILCVNMQFYTTPIAAMMGRVPYWDALHDRWATLFIETFCEGKFYILFSFLFGLGISIQMLRADVRGRSFAWHQLKRMLVLLGIGLAHAILLWVGDVLVTYALLGIPLLLLVRRRPKTLLIVALIVYAVPVLLVGAVTVYQTLKSDDPDKSRAGLAKLYKLVGIADPNEPLEPEDVPKLEKRIYSSGSYGEIFRLRGFQLVIMYVKLPFVFWPTVLAMFLLGLWAGKTGFFTDLSARVPLLSRWRWPALAVGLSGNLAYALIRENLGEDAPPWMQFLSALGQTVGAPALTFFYVSTLILLFQREAWQRRLRPLAYVGRMALTNYLLQSVICTTIFYSYGGGLYASLGPLAGLALTVLIYVPQIPFSMLWLSRFRFGPMEWLWRTLTYGKAQPMRL